MTQIEQIIAEIERLKSEASYKINCNCDANRDMVTDIANCQRIAICDQLLDLINSLPAEQPSEDLEEAFDEVLPNPNWYISNDGEDAYNVKQMEEMFCAGAQWQKDKLLNKACKWLNKNVVEYHPRKGELRPIVNINAFREAMEKEDK